MRLLSAAFLGSALAVFVATPAGAFDGEDTFCIGDVSEAAESEWRGVVLDATNPRSPTQASSRNVVADETLRVANRAFRFGNRREREIVTHDVASRALGALPSYDGSVSFHRWLRQYFRRASATHYEVPVVAPAPRPGVARTATDAALVGLFVSDVRARGALPPASVASPSAAPTTEAPAPTAEVTPPKREEPGLRRTRLVEGPSPALHARVESGRDAAAASRGKAAPRDGAKQVTASVPPPLMPPRETEFRRQVLARHPDLGADEAKEELSRLSESDQKLLRWRDGGLTDAEIGTRLGVTASVAADRVKDATAAFDAALAERGYAKRRYLSSRPNRSYDDFRRAAAALVSSQRRALGLLASGKHTEDVRRELALPNTIAARKLLESLHDALGRSLDGKPLLGPEVGVATAAVGPWPLTPVGATRAGNALAP